MVKLEEKHALKSDLLINATEDLWDQLDLFNTPYFSNLKNEKMDKIFFFKSQCAFFHAVAFFARPMSALASRIDSTKARQQLVENIYEEHGEMDEDSFHENTFIRWLNQLGLNTIETKQDLPLKPCVEAFNLALMGVCQTAAIEKGICALGVIEFMFSHISKFIASMAVDLKWIAPKNLIHYNLHADLDIKHSRELFEILDKIPQPDIAKCIEGVELGAFIFGRLYNDLASL